MNIYYYLLLSNKTTNENELEEIQWRGTRRDRQRAKEGETVITLCCSLENTTNNNKNWSVIFTHWPRWQWNIEKNKERHLKRVRGVGGWYSRAPVHCVGKTRRAIWNRDANHQPTSPEQWSVERTGGDREQRIYSHSIDGHDYSLLCTSAVCSWFSFSHVCSAWLDCLISLFCKAIDVIEKGTT